MADWFPKPDREAEALGERVVAALEADEVAYGVLPADSARLRGKLTTFRNNLNAADAAKAAQNTSVANKDAARTDFEDDLRAVVKIVQVNPIVTDELRTAAGLPIHDTGRSYHAPIAPRDLVAEAGANGTHRLKFNANGNTSGAMFVIEAKRATDTEFQRVDAITQTTYDAPGFTPGQRVDFRVRARRGTESSDPSNVATVFSG